MNARSLFRLVASSGLSSIAASGLSAAIVYSPVQSLSIGSMSAANYASFDFPLEPSPYNTFTGYDAIALNGFTKFDPSLGTLQEVRISMQVSGYFQLELSASADFVDYSGPFDTFTAEFVGGGSYFTGAVAYNPSVPPPRGYIMADEIFSFSSIGGTEFLEDHAYIDEGLGAYDLDYSVYGDAEYFGPETINGGILATHPFFESVDFVGTGSVLGLRAFTFFEIDASDLTTDLPVESVSMGVIASLDESTVTLQYVYDDGIGVIPEPSHLALFLALGMLPWVIVGRRRPLGGA